MATEFVVQIRRIRGTDRILEVKSAPDKNKGQPLSPSKLVTERQRLGPSPQPHRMVERLLVPRAAG